MYLQSLQHAVPPHAFSQADCFEILKDTPTFGALKSRSQSLLEKILKGDSGIGKRHFATEDLSSLFTLDGGGLNSIFEATAPKLSVEALSKSLGDAGIQATEIDALFICTCTGYLCPGLTSYVAETLGLSSHTYLQDIVGLGCGAAIPTLRAASGFLAANPDATVACIAVEVCSAAFYLDDDAGVLISASLFGDAAAASIWRGRGIAGQYQASDFDTIHLPEDRELLRFTNKGGKLRNQLHRSVPELAAKAVKKLYQRAELSDNSEIAAHVGGRDVLLSLESALEIPRLDASWEALREYGNNSSPSVLIAAEKLMQNKTAPDSIWLTSFGAGFAAHACRLERT